MTCPRCRANVLRNYDMIECLNCGTLYEPQRAWDLVANVGHLGHERAAREADRVAAGRRW